MKLPPLLPKSATNLLTFLQSLARGDEGSAILEFVAIAIPLFIPLILYFGVLNERVQENLSLQNLARQVARAYVTAPNEMLAGDRAEAVLSAFRGSDQSGKTQRQISISVDCSKQPCLTPDARVKVTLRLEPSGPAASDTQVVDAWR